jgi:hypothetical protein
VRDQSKQAGSRKRYALYTTVAVVLASVSIGGCGACDLIHRQSLDPQPNPATTGQEVTFTDAFTLYRSVDRLSLKFDLDGDGILETTATPIRIGSGSYSATVRKTYETPATIVVSSWLVADRDTGLGFPFIDANGQKRTLQIVAPTPPDAPPDAPPSNQPPAASFEMRPNPVERFADVTYDASASMDPDGQVAHYEWDLDNDGTFERDEGSNPSFTKSEGRPAGTYTIGLRVTDDGGDAATTTRQLIVISSVMKRAAKVAKRLHGARRFEFPPNLHLIDPGQYLLNGDDLISAGRKYRGKISASPFPAALQHGKRQVRWVSLTNATFDGETGAVHGTGYALLRFPAGGRACLAFTLDLPGTGRTTGSFRILGGTGAAKGLHGKGVGSGNFEGSEVSVRGRLHADFHGNKHYSLSGSGCAPLLG